MSEPVIPERMGQPLSYCDMEDAVLILQARLNGAEAKVAEQAATIATLQNNVGVIKELQERECAIGYKLSTTIAEQAATILQQTSTIAEYGLRICGLERELSEMNPGDQP